MYWDPFEEIRRMHEEMDRIFGRALGKERLLDHDKKGKQVDKFRAPVADLKETENSILATFELPGADKGDIELNVTEDSIEVKAEKKVEKKEKGSYSFSQSSFYRSIPLPKEVDASKAKASYKNGMLRIEVPKQEQLTHNKKRIQIE